MGQARRNKLAGKVNKISKNSRFVHLMKLISKHTARNIEKFAENRKLK